MVVPLPPPTWQLHLQGVARLRGPGASDEALDLSASDAAWLCLTALEPRSASRRIATLVWPGRDEKGALNNLRQRVHKLRRATGGRLVEMSETLVLADDLQLAEALADEGDAPPLLATFEFDERPDLADWLRARRDEQSASARQRRLAALADAEARQDWGRALRLARHALEADPLSEAAHRSLMRAHYLSGDRAAAVAAFERCERLLKDELGLRPDAETLALLATVEASGTPRAGAWAPLPASLLRPPRTVGRREQARQIEQALDAGQIPVLVGEAGLGKTRLLQDLVAARPGTLYTQARPSDAGVPFGVLARVLRVILAGDAVQLAAIDRRRLAFIVPELADEPQPPPALTQAQLQAAVSGLLATLQAQRGATLVLDDLHFADAASLELLRQLVDAAGLDTLPWVFAHRPPAAGEADEPLLSSLSESPRARWVRLSPLTAGDLQGLLESLALPGVNAAALAPSLARHTGGNPLYALETLRAAQAARPEPGTAGAALVLPRPEGIAHLIDRRLRRLSERAQALCRVAALAGPDFSAALAEHALATPVLLLADAWAELEAADVLRGNAFAHDLVRDGMLRATPAPVAAHAHRLIAEFLQRAHAEPARVAEHWQTAGEFRAAAQNYVLAAVRAGRAARRREQAQLLMRAGAAHEAAGDADAAIATRCDAIIHTLQGEGFEAAQTLCDSLLAAAGTGPQAGTVWARRATMMMNAGRHAQAVPAAQRALELLPGEQEALRIEATVALGMAYMVRGDTAAGFDLLRPWVDRIDAVGSIELRLLFRSAYSQALVFLDRLEEAEHSVALQAALARATGDDSEIVSATLGWCFMLLRRGDAAGAERRAVEAAAAQPDYALDGFVPGYTRHLHGLALCAQGRYDEGLGLLEKALQIIQATSPGAKVHAVAVAGLAEAMLQLRQTARAVQLLAQPFESLQPSDMARRWLLQAGLDRALGRSAEGALNAALQAAGGANGYWQMLAQVEQARQAEPAQAVALCEPVIDRALRQGDDAVKVAAASVRLGALLQAGPPAAARAAALQLEPWLKTCGSMLFYPPDVWLVCARAHARADEIDATERCLRAGLDWVWRVALPHVPAPFRDTFLHRHPAHAGLQLAQRRLAAGEPPFDDA